MTGSNVAVTVVHPGGVATAIVAGPRFAANCIAEEARERRERAKQVLRMPPRAAEIILDGVERHKGRVLVGSDAKGLALLERLMPVSYWTMRWGLLGRRQSLVGAHPAGNEAGLSSRDRF